MGEGVDWNLLAQYPNAGQAFEQSFNQGMQQNALSNFATNPTDPAAQAGAARYAPQAVMELKLGQMKEQQAAQQQQQQQWHEYAGQLAKWADTPEKWDQAVDYLLGQNHPDISTQDLMALKGQFSPALRQSFMALGGVQDDKPANPTADIQDFEYARAHGYGGSFTDFQQYVHPPSAVTIPYNATVTQGGGQTNLPTVSDQKGYDALPPGAHYIDPTGHTRVKGGQSGAGSTGGFQ